MHTMLCYVAVLAALSATSRAQTSKYRYPQYDYLYPQYQYKPYSYALYDDRTDCNQDCNRGYYPTYVRYLLTFRRRWNQTDYPVYKTSRRNEHLWNSYGNYTYKGKVKAKKPKKKGHCCWEFKALPLRKSPDLRRGRMRIEYRQLTAAQRNSLHAAFNVLKGFGVYDYFVSRHNGGMAPFAHSGAAFLPWHREYLFRLENALYAAGYTGPGLPYWDSTLDQGLPTPSDSAIWTEEYLGNIDGVVNIGFAALWQSIPICQNVGATLRRNGARGWLGNCLLMSDDDIEYVYSKRCFRDIVCNNDCKFESDHAAVHNFVGGHMADPSCAPSDPVFFLHHTFIDCIWEHFRQNHQESNIYKEYPNPANGDNIGAAGHAYNMPMHPFGPPLLNGHGIEKFYEAYYKCKARPMKCSANSHCKSPLLWCRNGRCTGKVKPGGNCTGLPAVACYCREGIPFCSWNICGCRELVLTDKRLPSK